MMTQGHLILAFLLLLGGVHSCRTRAERDGCEGGRPPTPEGCCPVGVGEACGQEVGEMCDGELGYRCEDEDGHDVTLATGTCVGRHNVRVTAKGQTTVTLQWEDYKPQAYYFEYVLLFLDDSFSANIQHWKLWDIGTEPSYTVTKLTPATVYFMRLALWTDDMATQLGNFTEVAMVTTDPASHCSYNDQQYQVGQVMDNCEDRCTCTATGSMNCTPSCPVSSMPDVPEGCTLVFEEECICNATISCPDQGGSTPQEVCQYRGAVYADGATWTDTTNCTSCTCEAGHVACHATCQEPEVPEGCVNPQRATEENGCCPVIVCDNNTGSVEGEEWCLHNGSAYCVGVSFTQGCSLCVCGHDNHVNCTFTSCPALELPVPSILCPNPQVRPDGCCDTVFCTEQNPDQQALLSRLMALSFGPNTLTISFEVDHVSSSSPSVTQDRYEVMTSDGQGGADSWSSRTYTPTSLDVDDNVSSPSDLLHADSAIRVDDRVYITLDGLRPNTTYYVRVEPVTKRDMGVTEEYRFNSTITGFFVAKTMDIDATCLVGDVMFQNGDVTSDNCEEVCRCVRGDVICQRVCPEEDELVMVPSATCPEPRLVPSPHRPCCNTWRCFPQDGGCIYKNIILKHDELVYEGACGQKCKCTQGEVTCTPVCPTVFSAPHAECILTNVTDSCCPVWMCPTDRRPPLGLTLASQIGLYGPCTNNDTFKTLLRTAFQNLLEGHLSCADRASSLFVGCRVRDVVVMCPRLGGHRSRREATQLKVITVIVANISESNTESKIRASFNQSERVLSAMFTSSNVQLPLDNGVNVTSSGDFLYLGLSHICPEGFFYQRDVCVPQYLYRPPSQLQQQNVSMTVAAISPHSATLVWPTLSRVWHPHVTALVIEFQVTSSSEWNRTVTLDPMTTNHTLKNLSALRSYSMRLVALTIYTSSDMVLLSTAHFTTASHEVLTSALTFHPLQVSLGVTSVTLSWPALASDVIAAISSLKVTCRQSAELDKDGKWRDVDPHSTQVTLAGLDPGNTYVTTFLVHLVNGTTLTFTPLHFVTKTADSREVAVVPLLATCAVLVLLSVLIPVVFFLWRRAHRKAGTETAFENKTYGANISSLCATQAKNECARPQDPDSGSTAASMSTEASQCPQQA